MNAYATDTYTTIELGYAGAVTLLMILGTLEVFHDMIPVFKFWKQPIPKRHTATLWRDTIEFGKSLIADRLKTTQYSEVSKPSEANEVQVLALENQMTKKRILLLEDDLAWATLLKQSLRRANKDVDIQHVSRAIDAQLALIDGSFDLIVADYKLEGSANGLDFYGVCQKTLGDVPFVLVSSLSPGSYEKLSASADLHPEFIPKSTGVHHVCSTVQALIA